MRRALLAVVGAAALVDAVGATERLDDRASPNQRVVATVEWAEEATLGEISETELNAMVARIPALEVRLDTRRFVGQRAQIYLRLPIDIRGLKSAGGLRMSWKTRGVFEDGSVAPGNRALIFEGVVSEAMMSDIFDVSLEIDARTVTHGLNFDPIYEIDTL